MKCSKTKIMFSRCFLEPNVVAIFRSTWGGGSGFIHKSANLHEGDCDNFGGDVSGVYGKNLWGGVLIRVVLGNNIFVYTLPAKNDTPVGIGLHDLKWQVLR